MKLGECQSKCEHIAKVPLRNDTARKLNQIYLAKGVCATTSIEGNTLTEEEVRMQIEGKLDLPASKEYLKVEVENIISVCNEISNAINMGDGLNINLKTIKELNFKVLQGLDLIPEVLPGEVRTHNVRVGKYKGAPAQDCEYLLGELSEWLSSMDVFRDESMNMASAIIKAIIAHLYIAWIHPFGDGNGRTARLIEFLILMKAGVPGPAAHLLSNHYNQTRSRYYRILDYSSRSQDDGVMEFVRYAVQGLHDQLLDQLNYIWDQVWDVTWRNIVHEKFGSPKEVDRRKKYLLLDLSREIAQERAESGYSITELTQVSARVMKLYMGKVRRTVSRDMDQLVDMRFLSKAGNRYKINRQLILSFLPVRAGD